MSKLITKNNFVWFIDNKLGEGLTSEVYKGINLVFCNIYLIKQNNYQFKSFHQRIMVKM
jgi:hypothetical protein